MEHVTPILRKLHRKPFKIFLITNKVLNGLARKYLTDVLVLYQPKKRPVVRTKTMMVALFQLVHPRFGMTLR